MDPTISFKSKTGKPANSKHPVRIRENAPPSPVAISSPLAILSRTNKLHVPVVDPILKRELLEYSRHFGKIADRFSFLKETSSYQLWVMRFHAEMESYGLDDCLSVKVDPVNEVSQLRQKTVYHMILQCVPGTIQSSVTASLPSEKHTGYDVWNLLRQHIIGDEATYLQSLETRFNSLRWIEEEDFPGLEIRFDSIVTELRNAKQLKPDHVLKSTLMRAIEFSSKKDARGTHVFDRLNMIAKIHGEKAYKDWMTHMRVEAQQIQDGFQYITTRGTKRNYQEIQTPIDRNHHNAMDQSIPVSYVSPGPRHGNPHKPRAPGVCYQMQQKGSCKYGDKCHFKHDLVGGFNRFGNGTQDRHYAPNALILHNQGQREVCRNYRIGKCLWGDRCRWEHVGNQGPMTHGGHPTDSNIALRRIETEEPQKQGEYFTRTQA